MAHYAKVVNNIVEQVIVAEEEFFETFVDNTPGEWIQTSYNTLAGVHYQEDGITPSGDQTKALRKNFAGVGFTYDRELDAFIPPVIYPSWVLNGDTCQWEPPIPMPQEEYDNGIEMEWNEDTLAWIELTGETV